jgi:F420-0:gamma-glutamyl ligase
MSDASSLPILDLNALVLPVGRVHLDTEDYDVLPVQGDAITIFEQIVSEAANVKPTDAAEEKAATERYLDKARRIVYAIAPSIPRERVHTMAIAQLTGIIGLSMGQVQKVRSLMASAVGKESGPVRRKTRTASGRR